MTTPGVPMVFAGDEVGVAMLPTPTIPIFSPRAAERIAAHIPGALEPELVVGAGHFLQEDKGEEIGRRIARFVLNS